MTDVCKPCEEAMKANMGEYGKLFAELPKNAPPELPED